MNCKKWETCSRWESVEPVTPQHAGDSLRKVLTKLEAESRKDEMTDYAREALRELEEKTAMTDLERAWHEFKQILKEEKPFSFIYRFVAWLAGRLLGVMKRG